MKSEFKVGRGHGAEETLAACFAEGHWDAQSLLRYREREIKNLVCSDGGVVNGRGGDSRYVAGESVSWNVVSALYVTVVGRELPNAVHVT